MKFTLLSAILAISAAAVSAAPSTEATAAAPKADYHGTIYIYANSLPHPRTTFLKTSGNGLVTNGAACKGVDTLPAKNGAVSGSFYKIANQWDFNGAHDNEIRMGYIKVGSKCLSLTNGNALTLGVCPSFKEEIKAGNKFAWFHDVRNSAYWAYGGDADAIENNGLTLDGTNLQTTGKTLTGTNFHEDSTENLFLGLGYIALGHTGKHPTGCA